MRFESRGPLRVLGFRVSGLGPRSGSEVYGLSSFIGSVGLSGCRVSLS